MDWTRREFLKQAGLSSFFLMAVQSGVVSAGGLKEIAEALERGDESWVNTICQLCPGACGMTVRKIGPWPVSIKGNPLHPVNRGALCPKGVAGILSLYDPDRIRSPLKREGERGEGKWKEISWKEALAEVTNQLKKIREQKESHKVAVVGGRYRGLMRTLFERFLTAYGSPNYIDNGFAPWQGPREAMEKTHGISAEPVYDLGKSRFILSFSAPLLEAGNSPVENLRAWGQMRRGVPNQRGHVIHLDTRLSITAAKADEWIPVRPGTEGLAALGIINIILRENLYDGSYLGNHSDGFSNFKNLVLQSYDLEEIVGETGVPVDTIIRVAREFAAAKPAVAVSGRIDPKSQIAVHTLNALAGSINVPGGVLVPRQADYRTFKPVEGDAIALEGLKKEKAGLLSPGPYDLKALLFYYTNPLFSNPDPQKIREAVLKVPFLAGFSPFMDETTALCDLILPDHHFLERWQDAPSSTIEGFPLVGLAQPVHAPFYNTRHAGDVLLDIARGLGEGVAGSFPWEDFRACLTEGLDNLYRSGGGDVFGTDFESSWTTLLSRGGWWFPSYGSFQEFQARLASRGGWWNPVYFHEEWSRVFNTGSRKFEFPPLKDLPRVIPIGNGDYPLTLNSFPLMPLTGGRNANQAWLADIGGSYAQRGWQTWVEMHPETARKFGIRDRDEVWVESSRGKIKCTAKLYEGTHPDVVGVPLGYGHTEMGRWAKGVGANPREIQDADSESAGLPRERMTRVKVYRA